MQVINTVCLVYFSSEEIKYMNSFSLAILSTFKSIKAYRWLVWTEQIWTESHKLFRFHGVFNAMLFVSSPPSFLFLIHSFSLSYFSFFLCKISSQIEQMQADISQEVHPSEPQASLYSFCLWDPPTHSFTDCEGTSFPFSLTGHCVCVWV